MFADIWSMYYEMSKGNNILLCPIPRKWFRFDFSLWISNVKCIIFWLSFSNHHKPWNQAFYSKIIFISEKEMGNRMYEYLWYSFHPRPLISTFQSKLLTRSIDDLCIDEYTYAVVASVALFHLEQFLTFIG